MIASGDVARNWHARNLLIRFDESGVMHTKELIGDERVMERERAQLAKGPPLDLSQPTSIALTRHCDDAASNPAEDSLTEMTLTKEGVQLSRHNEKYLERVS